VAVPKLSRIFPLSTAGLKAAVNLTSPGAYMFGSLTQSGKLNPYYVGRADVDVADRLSSRIGKYDAFVFAYASSPMNAYFMECELYHAYLPRDNKVHPAKPENSKWKCPVCGQ
jgi:hypothetical protein